MLKCLTAGPYNTQYRRFKQIRVGDHIWSPHLVEFGFFATVTSHCKNECALSNKTDYKQYY